MKLYNAPIPAPNPRRVRIFLAEKGVSVPLEDVSLRDRAHKAPEFKQKNSLGQLPVLALDDGTHLSESVAICRYLEELHPTPPLFGRTALERANVDMWIRRLEMTVMTPVGAVWVHTHPLTSRLGTQYKDYGESNRERYGRAPGHPHAGRQHRDGHRRLREVHRARHAGRHAAPARVACPCVGAAECESLGPVHTARAFRPRRGCSFSVNMP